MNLTGVAINDISIVWSRQIYSEVYIKQLSSYKTENYNGLSCIGVDFFNGKIWGLAIQGVLNTPLATQLLTGEGTYQQAHTFIWAIPLTTIGYVLLV